jgi:hypothetical protein
MSQITTRTIRAPKKRRKGTVSAKASRQQEQQAFNAYQRREAMRKRAERQFTVRSDGVTRCSKCPPKHCCPECARINNGRQIAGLIRPRGSPEPHSNNCMPCIPREQGYMGNKPDGYHPRGYEIVSIEVTPLGGGWYLGQAFLGLEAIYERKFRNREAARDYAMRSMVDIREGLRFEQGL